MNMTVVTDENEQNKQETPGAQLARIRENKGFDRKYVASELLLRVKVIELLEAADYQQLPGAAFIQGYLRAYAKFLGVAPEPYILMFNAQYSIERKPEKALWQSRRESNKGELIVRWITVFIAVAAIAAVSFWWQTNKDAQPFFSAKSKAPVIPITENTLSKHQAVKPKSDPKLTTLSKLQSMFLSNTENNTEKSSTSEKLSEKQGG